MQKSPFQPLNDAEIELLDDLLLEYANESNDCIINVSELHGFLTAVISSPELTPPSKWLKASVACITHPPRAWLRHPPYL